MALLYKSLEVMCIKSYLEDIGHYNPSVRLSIKIWKLYQAGLVAKLLIALISFGIYSLSSWMNV